ncbi:MAG: SUMF1/EgtB/PvdO family nonheme iron enzyme [Leptolyngbya sp. SIO3F4]|nr:SUMF1/EgtB/PvdO family nonheme iron enzyme [Leptolyngbya sp. SIO3F4]
MIRIFLAHANEDKEAVSDLYYRLKEQGFQPWMDKEDLVPGQNWRSEIPEAIKNSQIFLACLSEVSIAKEGYVQREFKLALSKYVEMSPGSAYLIPVCLDECEIPDLSEGQCNVNLSDIHGVNLFESDGFEQLVRAINYHFPEASSQRTDMSESIVLRDTPSTIARRSNWKASSRKTKIIDLGDNVTLELVYIPDGTFLMGTPEDEKGGTFLMGTSKDKKGERLQTPEDERDSFDCEKPQHEVTIPGFWMGKYPVTQAQYKVVTGRNPSKTGGFLSSFGRTVENYDNKPVQQVSWHTAISFCKQASFKTGENIRLPSEAEWEYACRAGKTAIPYSFGYIATRNQANFGYLPFLDITTLGLEQTTPVDSFPSNDFDLYDMHGNVWEWCQDHWHENYKGAPNDGSVWVKDDAQAYRVMRGGSWKSFSKSCRSASRRHSDPDYRNDDIGFRVVFSPQPTKATKDS